MNPAQQSTFWRPTAEDEAQRIQNDNQTLAKAWETVSSRLDPEQVKELEKLPSFRDRIDAAVSMSPRRRQHAHHEPMAISASIGGDVSQW